MTGRRWTDDAGHQWPVTGSWCAACGLPMTVADASQTTHPTCTADVLPLFSDRPAEPADAREVRTTWADRAAHTATLVEAVYRRPGPGRRALLICRCDRCAATVTHGGGSDPDHLDLGHRAAHCGCPGGYRIVDRAGVIAGRQASA